MEPILKAENIKFRFLGNKTLIENINLHVDRGEIVVLLGPSGCGKSTLLRLLIGLINAQSGKIQRHFKKHSVVFQDARLLNWRNVRENIQLPLEIKAQNSSSPNSEVDQILREVNLFESQNLFPHELSGGMKMRCSLARALITNPEILFMDEPFSALDEETREKLQLELRQNILTTNKSCIFVTHSIDEACFLSDRIYTLREGSLFEFSTGLIKQRTWQTRLENDFFQATKKLRQFTASISQNSHLGLRI